MIINNWEAAKYSWKVSIVIQFYLGELKLNVDNYRTAEITGKCGLGEDDYQ